MPSGLGLFLVDPCSELCEQFDYYFEGMEGVEVVCGYFQSLSKFDCMVSPANSFGFMDGGVDLAITQFFGINLMHRVQAHIIRHFLGEQPVGTSFIIPTGHEEHPFLAHSPTMRVPMTIRTTDYVYKAMWATLLAVRQHNENSGIKIKTLACPGLGTLTGCVSPRSAARQMSIAYRNFLNPPGSLTWEFAEKRQRAIGLGGDHGIEELIKEK